MIHMTRRGALGLAGAALLATGSAYAEPVDDGTWSKHPLWPTLKKTRLAADQNGMVRAAFTPEVSSLSGKAMTISGFILPIEASKRYNHFILSRYSPECPFCPSGGPTEVIEVFTDKAVGPTPALVTMRGTFSVQDNMEAGLFYRMKGGVLV